MAGLIFQRGSEPLRGGLTTGLQWLIGCDRQVARIVAEATGDAIDVVTRPFVTIGFVTPDANSFAIVLHSMDEAGQLALSVSATFIPWVPTIPHAIADVAFRKLGATALLMRLAAHDAERAVVASRFGFELVEFDGERVTLRLSRETLRPALVRRLRRHMH